jgi:TaqI-like C-terminal specificity domain
VVDFYQRGTDIEKYPALKAYLEQFRTQLEPKPEGWEPKSPAPEDKWLGRKGGIYKWFEIQDPVAYASIFGKTKIIYGHFARDALFSIDASGLYCNDKGYVIASESQSLLAILNSKAMWFLIMGKCPDVRGGYFEQRAQYIETLPIPAATKAQQSELSHLSTACAQAAKARLTAQRDFGRRILDLLPRPTPKGAQLSLGDKLSSWWQLEDFKAFQFEVQKRFKTDIPLRERNDWETLFTEQKNRVHQLSANIAATERSIDAMVYTLFSLNAAEIALVERAVVR